MIGPFGSGVKGESCFSAAKATDKPANCDPEGRNRQELKTALAMAKGHDKIKGCSPTHDAV